MKKMNLAIPVLVLGAFLPSQAEDLKSNEAVPTDSMQNCLSPAKFMAIPKEQKADSTLLCLSYSDFKEFKKRLGAGKLAVDSMTQIQKELITQNEILSADLKAKSDSLSVCDSLSTSSSKASIDSLKKVTQEKKNAEKQVERWKRRTWIQGAVSLLIFGLGIGIGRGNIP